MLLLISMVLQARRRRLTTAPFKSIRVLHAADRDLIEGPFPLFYAQCQLLMQNGTVPPDGGSALLPEQQGPLGRAVSNGSLAGVHLEVGPAQPG